MSGQGIAAHVNECKTVDDNVGQVIGFERRIVGLSEKFLQRDDYLEFVREQLRLHESGGMQRPDGEAPSLEAMLQVVGDLTDVPQTVALGCDSELVRTMVAMTPFLRSQLVFRDVSPGHAPGSLQLEYARVALAVLCIYLFAEAARANGMRRITFQTISRLAHDFDSLARLLALGDAVVVWQRGVPIDVTSFERSEFRLAFMRLAKALLPAVQRKRQARLGDLLREHVPADRLARALFLKEAARHLAGKLVPLKQEPTRRYNAGLRGRFATAVRRWVLANVHEEVLQAAYGRASTARLPRPM
ncbi:MAG: hypothetical protein ACRDFW_05715 [bacterium]